MKILFYETKDIEYNYFINNYLKDIESYFFKNPINESVYVDEKYKDAQGLCVFVSSILNKNVLSKFPNLKCIFLRCSGYSNVDLSYCRKNNIKIFYCPSYSSSSVAEFAFSLILSLSRKIVKAQNDVKTGEIDHNELTGFELNNKTLGLVGLGRIGTKILKIANGFNMKTLIYDIIKKADYTYSELDELYKNSDIIVLSCPLTNKTKGLINYNSINKMKKSVIIVNVARGEIINTRALVDSLIKKRISGAALDTIECEETMCESWDFCINTDRNHNCLKKYLFIQKLKTMDNVIITPHIAYNTNEAINDILKTTKENIMSSFKINKDTKNLIML